MLDAEANSIPYQLPPKLIGSRCPICNNEGTHRRGVHFEHEMICRYYHVWDPEHRWEDVRPWVMKQRKQWVTETRPKIKIEP
jgi:hypothetical protein